MTRRILTIEDDAAIRRGICDALRFAGYQVLQAGDGLTGRQLALQAEYDVLLLDLVLPGRDGLDILADLRRLRPTVPVIILTALGEEADRVRGLREGADDYVVKPFSVKELLARVEALIRRSPQRPRVLGEFAIPGGSVCLDRCEVRFNDGGREELSEREVELLRYLAANPSRAITRDELLENVWRLSPDGLTTRTIDMHVARLREKLRDNGHRPAVIQTVRGRGYMWADATPAAGDGD
ncbi:MAG: response regulator transcription factor [Patescibacteria group bacterium]|nr:response regulator transcription factor [Patescibacteria group bacterium]